MVHRPPHRPWLAGLLLLVVSPFQAGADDDAMLLAYRQQIERAYHQRDNATIEKVRESLLEAGRTSGEEDRATYYAALARLRQSTVAADNKAQARDYLERCISELAPLLARRPDYAEARALNASCLGASSSYYVLRAATRGLAAGREMAAAVKLAPDNPWVVLQDGVSDYSTPPLFGGDKDRALLKLRRAAELFLASRPAGSTQAVPGEAEAWLYIGRCLAAKGQAVEAREALEQARRYAPESRDVAEALAAL